MDDLKIYVDRLKEGSEEKLHLALFARDLALDEAELHFLYPIQVDATVYLANDHLIIELKVAAKAALPCSICNDPTECPITPDSFRLTKPIEEIKGAVYDLHAEIRESILLNTPLFAECHQGNCPKRQEFKKYLNTPVVKEENVHFPFADLN